MGPFLKPACPWTDWESLIHQEPVIIYIKCFSSPSLYLQLHIHAIFIVLFTKHVAQLNYKFSFSVPLKERVSHQNNLYLFSCLVHVGFKFQGFKISLLSHVPIKAQWNSIFALKHNLNRIPLNNNNFKIAVITINF